MLLQRSDVETFLLSSLHLVRKEMERDSMREVIGQGEWSQGEYFLSVEERSFSEPGLNMTACVRSLGSVSGLWVFVFFLCARP